MKNKFKVLLFLIMIAFMPISVFAGCSNSPSSNIGAINNDTLRGVNRLSFGCNCTGSWLSEHKINVGSVRVTIYPKGCSCHKQCKTCWQGCDGTRMCPNWTYVPESKGVEGVPANSNSCWTWKCKAGHEKVSDTEGCKVPLNVAACIADNGFVANGECTKCGAGQEPVGQKCRNKLGPDQGYESPDSDVVLDCKTLKFEDGTPYRMVIDKICVRCWDGTSSTKKYIKNTEAYIANGGNCGKVALAPQSKFVQCALNELIKTTLDFENCLKR